MSSFIYKLFEMKAIKLIVEHVFVINSTSTMKIKIILFLYLCLIFKNANGQADLTLTISDFLNWQPSVINQGNISNTPIANRVKSLNYQIASNLDTNAKILYSPDGMNNFGPYIDSASQFNLFNFSHWQYIDILAWFGGSASESIIIPSKAWVDAAHKNGVKVIGTVFFAPIVYGGSQASVQSFLQQDLNGNFIAASQLKAIANYYNFDGWVFNFETQVNSATGALASNFISQFDSIYSGESIWYDSMLQNGSIIYQNKLNASNAYFFQHSTGLFTNYNWSQASTVAGSATYATSIARSPFDVYTGADIWPGRTAQPAFSNYGWIDKIFPLGVGKTSIALFATNFTFNYSPFSIFNTDPTDYVSFYEAERKIFSGVDQNPFLVDNQWKGIGNYIAVRSVITQWPFDTDFNTGHGLNYFNNGSIFSLTPWHNMSLQSILPSWTFYNSGCNIEYDFNDAYNGGSSLLISSSGLGSNLNIPLFSTELVATPFILFPTLTFKSTSTTIDSIGLEFKTKNNSILVYYKPLLNGTWESAFLTSGNSTNADTIIAINLLIQSSGPFSINLGRVYIEPIVLGLSDNKLSSNFKIFPNPSLGDVYYSSSDKLDGRLLLYDLNGKIISNIQVNDNSEHLLNFRRKGVYLYEFKSKKSFTKGKIIIE